MKTALHLAAWAAVALLVVYTCIHPERGVLYHNPLACLGVGLFGLGVYIQLRRTQHLTT